jgi:hypothetical protein
VLGLTQEYGFKDAGYYLLLVVNIMLGYVAAPQEESEQEEWVVLTRFYRLGGSVLIWAAYFLLLWLVLSSMVNILDFVSAVLAVAQFNWHLVVV